MLPRRMQPTHPNNQSANELKERKREDENESERNTYITRSFDAIATGPEQAHSK